MKWFIRFLSLVFILAVVIAGVAFYVLPLPGRPTVLMYHFVGNEMDADASKNFVSRDSFQRQMSFLKNFGYRVISLDKYYGILNGTEYSEGKEIVITFDDGNYTFETDAVPVLKQYRFPVAVFIVSDNAEKKAHGSMSLDSLRELNLYPWITWGSHTQSHPFLDEIPEESLTRELRGSKEVLEKLFEKPIHYLAYPFGNFNREVMLEAENSGYRLGFTTSPKKLGDIPEGPYAIPRTKITKSSDHPVAFWFKASGLYNFFKYKFGRPAK